MFERRTSRSGWAGAAVALLFAAAIVAAETPKSAAETLVELYVPMQEALAGDSAKSVKEQAAKLAGAAAEAAKSASEKGDLEAVAAAAKGMTATDIEDLREQFRPLSRALATLVSKESVAGHGIFYCPMYDAYWVQKKGEVANPYYGKFMLRCGEPVDKVSG